MRWPTCQNNCKTLSDGYQHYCFFCKRAIDEKYSWGYPDCYKPIEDPEIMIERLESENCELKSEIAKLRLQLNGGK